MKLIAIDGACRRNGKPDCASAGAAVICADDHFEILSAYEYRSTNQRGELLALLKALDYAGRSRDSNVYIVTDSEYIFNAMNKKWYEGWMNKGWITATGDTVKNKDIWVEIAACMQRCSNIDIMFYHIKGHCISFGRVTADNMLTRDPSGTTLFNALCEKYNESKSAKQVIFSAAQDLSERNNGFRLCDDTFKAFIVMNTLADAAATKVVDAADNLGRKM